MKFYIGKIYDLLVSATFLVFCVFVACTKETNLAKCNEASLKKDIVEVETVEELEIIESTKPTSNCERLTYDNDAQVLIQEASTSAVDAVSVAYYARAAVILEKLVEFYPEEYERYGRLAAAYAGAGGVELAQFLKQLSGASDGIFATGKENFPSPEDDNYDDVKVNLTSAVEWIDEKIVLKDLAAPAQSDQLQAMVYRTAQTLIIANGFLVLAENGEWDLSSVEDITAEDLDSIIANLDVIADKIPDPKTKAKLEQFAGASDLTDEEKKELLKAALESSP